MTIAPPDLAKLSADLARSIPASIEAQRRPIPEVICRASLIDTAWQVKTMAGLIERHAMQASAESLTKAAASTWMAMHELRRIVKELGAPPPEKADNA